MTFYHKIENLRFSKDSLILTIDGAEREYAFKDIPSALANASETNRTNCEISPSGYGIHWTLLDEDLSIDGLLGIAHNPEFGKKSA